jgi:hypothetical protein
LRKLSLSANRNNSGQLTVEAVLILAIFVSVMYAGSRALRDGEVLARLVERPWGYIAGMIENGLWQAGQAGQGQHPHHIRRHGTPQGDLP